MSCSSSISDNKQCAKRGYCSL
ncbi:hypothetical protein PP427_gp010 [Salmonella phage KM16]|nr:hypothetical protein PP427_gp010 [Salmonella phage KM16]